MLCLIILYGNNNITRNIYPDFKGKWIDNYYQSSDKFQYILKNINYNIDITHHKMLQLITDQLLNLDVNKRIKTFSEFIYNDIFIENNFIMGEELGDLTAYELKSSIPNDAYYIANKVINNIISVMQYSDDSNKKAFLTLELIYVLWEKYSKNMQNFMVSCLWLANKVTEDIILLQDLISAPDDDLLEQTALFALDILEKEKGIISRPTPYDYLTSLDMIAKALPIMKNVKMYSKMGARNASMDILDSETANEANNRISKIGLFRKTIEYLEEEEVTLIFEQAVQIL